MRSETLRYWQLPVRSWFGWVVQLITQLQAAKIFRKDSPLDMAYSSWAKVHDLVALAIEGHIKISIEDSLAKPPNITDLESRCLSLFDYFNEALFKGFIKN